MYQVKKTLIQLFRHIKFPNTDEQVDSEKKKITNKNDYFDPFGV